MANTSIRMFGELRAIREQAGLPSAAEVDIPTEGVAAAQLAEMLELPLDRIEGVFVNHRVYGLDRIVMPGDAVAFVPPGTPGPHRVFLGLWSAGKRRPSEPQ